MELLRRGYSTLPGQCFSPGHDSNLTMASNSDNAHVRKVTKYQDWRYVLVFGDCAHVHRKLTPPQPLTSVTLSNRGIWSGRFVKSLGNYLVCCDTNHSPRWLTCAMGSVQWQVVRTDSLSSARIIAVHHLLLWTLHRSTTYLFGGNASRGWRDGSHSVSLEMDCVHRSNRFSFRAHKSWWDYLAYLQIRVYIPTHWLK